MSLSYDTVILERQLSALSSHGESSTTGRATHHRKRTEICQAIRDPAAQYDLNLTSVMIQTNMTSIPIVTGENIVRTHGNEKTTGYYIPLSFIRTMRLPG